ncbi:MAG TPA: hypothetical protein VM242_15750 [Acidimicrobiales bacterium]|jgi:hypothetical protein|nr:hypothetical protein [Acidimicrobiales bacterium]
MAPTTPDPGGADPLVPRLDERVVDAFAEYATTVDEAFPPQPGRTGVGAAYASYASEVDRVFRAPDLPNRAWELSVSWYRALQGTSPAEPLARYNDLVAAAVDVGLGQQKVMETYQALVAAALHATENGDAAVLERAYEQYAAAVRRAWAEADPAGLTAPVVLAAAQSILAATSLHGLALQAARDGRPGAPPAPTGRRDAAV